MNEALPSPSALAALEARLLDLLAAHPAGLSEHELLKKLRASDPLFAGFSAREPLKLFRGHYLLFHALYRLRDLLAGERRGRGDEPAQSLAEIADEVTGKVVERCGHFMAEDRPDAVQAALLEHFERA